MISTGWRTLFRTLNFQLGIRRRMPILSEQRESQDFSVFSVLATRYSPLTPIISARLSRAKPRIRKTEGWGVRSLMVTYLKYGGAPTFAFRPAHVAATFRWPPEGVRYNDNSSAPTFSSSRRPSQLDLDERRMRGRARGQRAAGEHAGGGPAGADEGFFAIGGRAAAHVAFHVGEAGAARAGAQMRAG